MKKKSKKRTYVWIPFIWGDKGSLQSVLGAFINPLKAQKIVDDFMATQTAATSCYATYQKLEVK